MKKSMLLRLFAALFAVTLFAGACGGGSSSSDTASDDAGSSDSGSSDDSGDSADDTADDADSGSDDSGDAGDSGDGDDVALTQGGGLKAVMDRGTLNCGVSGSATAFSVTQADGSQEGFDADYCRAAAAALFGDSTKVNFTALSASERFTAVQTGEVDVLFRNTTWTQSRDASGDVGLDFGPTTYYDGQQLMAKADKGFSNASTVADIDGAIVCTNAGTTTEKNISEAADAAGVTIDLQTFEDWNTAVDGFIEGSCDILTTDGSGLVGAKAEQQPDGEEWVIFPSAPISKEPLGPAYPQNNSEFADVIDWTVFATILADEYGITSANVDDMLANPPSEEVTRLLGGEGELQTKLGLKADAFYQVIKQVGNYNELYEKHLVPVGLTREGSANALYTDGGLLYAPPAR